MAQPLWRRVWSFLKKLKIELPFEAAIPLLGIYLEKTLIGKDSDEGRDGGREEKRMTEDEMAGWHHGLDGRESV